MDPFSTHLQALAAAVTITSGPILEVGCGDYSTPLLHELTRHRRLVSLEMDKSWLERFTYLSSPWHTFKLTNYDEAIEFSQEWSVAFIDHAPAERRIPDVLRLRGKTRLFVIHDTESSVYNYNAISPQFKYRLDFNKYTPWTTIFSDDPF